MYVAIRSVMHEYVVLVVAVCRYRASNTKQHKTKKKKNGVQLKHKPTLPRQLRNLLFLTGPVLLTSSAQLT